MCEKSDSIPAAFLILVSIVLWFGADPISKRLIPKHAGVAGSGPRFQEIEGFVLAVAGLVLVIFSMTTMLRLGMSYQYTAKEAIRIRPDQFLYPMIERGIRVIIGLILLFRAEGLA